MSAMVSMNFMMRKLKSIESFGCPHCGTAIPADSPACPECGSDRETGWAEDALSADWSPPEDEQPERPRKRLFQNILKYGFMAIAVVMLAAFIAIGVPYGIYISGAVIVALAIAFVAFRERPPSDKGVEKALEQELFTLSGRDPSRVERLVMLEKDRTPDASRTELLQNAIDRLIRDRSR
jgi:hypothetical protein